MNHRIALSFALLLALLTLQSCISHAPAARTYALPALDNKAAPPAQCAKLPAHITVSIPKYLKRTEMRIYDASTGEVKPCNGALWAIPLQELLVEAFTNALHGKTATITCTAFAPDFNGTFQAAGTIEVTTDKGVVTKEFAFTLPPPKGATPLAPATIARQYSEAVFQLSQLACQD